jgi:tryptophanyl-tRNA synthetase
MESEVAVTGIKPTGDVHLGNYLGMFAPALRLAERRRTLCFVADLHALIGVRDPAAVRRRTREVAAAWLALGLDPATTALYRQSDVPELSELTWILSCFTAKGLLNRAHAYKAAVQRNRDAGREPDAGVTAGLYGYPVLMAADILGVDAAEVPVGGDQLQHVEVARDVAGAFNAAHGPVLRLPAAVVDAGVPTVPGTDGAKMGKSADNVIPLLAGADRLRAAVMRIVTDSRPAAEPRDPATDPVFAIFRLVAGDAEREEMRRRLEAGGLGFGDAKRELADLLAARFAGPQARFAELIADPGEVERVLAAGAAAARQRAAAVMARVRAAVGLPGQPSAAPATLASSERVFDMT